MSIDLVKLAQLKATAEDLERQKERAAGRMQELLSRLKKDFDCDSLEDARKLLKRLGEQEQEKWLQFGEELKRFKEQYGELIQ